MSKDLDFLLHYPNLEDCSMQTFDDDKNRGDKRMARIFPYTDTVHEKLKELNKNGAGIFFSVNSMLEGKRDQASTTHINSWIAEIDNCSKEEQKKKIKNCPIKPSMIIESKKSYHLYWFATDGTIENFALVGRGLSEHFDSDRAVSVDYSRVLRFPGYYHCKNPDDRFRITTIYFAKTYYTEEEMLKAYPRTPPEVKKREIKKTYGDNFREVVNSRSAEGMLARISGTNLVSGESIDFKQNNNGTKQIIVNGKHTGCRIDKNDKIGSGDKGGPSWVNWVFRYGYYDGPQLYEWIMDNCEDLLPDNLKEKKPVIKNIKTNMTYKDLGFLYPDGPFNEKFGGLKSKELVMISAGANQGKTSFVLQILKKNKELGKKVAMINMQFDLYDTYKNEFFRAKGYKPQELKLIGTDLNPIDEYTQERLDIYIEKRRNEIQIVDMEQGTSAEEIIHKLTTLVEDGCSLIAIDALSDIGEVSNDLKAQNNIIKTFRNFVNQTGVALILIHHFNKAGNDYSGTGKFRDNANATIEIYPHIEKNGEYCRKFVLSKDKPHSNPIECYCYYELGDYKEVPPHLSGEND